MNVCEKIRNGYYDTKLPYAPWGTIAGKDYRKDDAQLKELFKADLFIEYEVTNNPKADLCYSKAWEKGHAYGLAEVAVEFGDLVELIR